MHGLSPGVKCVAPLFRHVLSKSMKLRRGRAPFPPQVAPMDKMIQSVTDGRQRVREEVGNILSI